MPASSAPCWAQRVPPGRVEYAEELIFPDFKLRPPQHYSEEYRARWEVGSLYTHM